jgi:hypothetical protein
MVRHAELKEQADSLPRGSAERKTLEKRISHLEQYRLPKEDERDAGQIEDVFDESGKTIGERHSVRKRTIRATKGPTRRIHDQTPVQHTKKNRLIRKALAGDCGPIRTQNALELRRAVRRLKEY